MSLIFSNGNQKVVFILRSPSVPGALVHVCNIPKPIKSDGILHPQPTFKFGDSPCFHKWSMRTSFHKKKYAGWALVL